MDTNKHKCTNNGICPECSSVMAVFKSIRSPNSGRIGWVVLGPREAKDMKWYVYYSDGYYDNGDVGLETFDEPKEVKEFIEKRLKKSEQPNPDNYKVVWGTEYNVITEEIAIKVFIEEKK